MTTLVSSPYVEQDHLLQLSKLQPEFQATAHALQTLRATSPKYAVEDYISSFNINEIVEQIRAEASQKGYPIPHQIYVIAFRSVLKPDIRSDPEKINLLYEADRQSHAEANILGGLLKYWYGEPDQKTGHNLATCWWRSFEDAKKGGIGKAHRESVSRTRDWYSYWKVEQYILQISEGDWQWKPWLQSACFDVGNPCI